MFYHTDAANFTSTFFNRTIDITEVPPLVDVQGLFLLAALAGLLGALGALPFPLPSGFATACCAPLGEPWSAKTAHWVWNFDGCAYTTIRQPCDAAVLLPGRPRR